jgi:PAS domain S-box-containing protein
MPGRTPHSDHSGSGIPLRAVLEQDGDGRAWGLLGFLADLTGRLASAGGETDLLRNALELLAGFLRCEGVFLAEHDVATDCLLVTASWPSEPSAATSGGKLEQLGGSGWWADLSRGDVAVEDGQLPRALAGSGVRSYAVQSLERDGSRKILGVTDGAPRRWRRDELWVLREVLGRVWPLVARCRSETAVAGELSAVRALLVQRHQSEAGGRVASDAVLRITEESERRRRLYETTLSNTPDLIYVFDLRHRFTYANAALLDAWGRSWNEVIGKTCLEVGYPDWQATRHDAEIEQVVRSKQSVRGEVPFRSALGERIHDYIFVPVLGADGEVEAVAGTTRDVTVLKRAEYLMAGQAQALELMATGAALPEVLEALCDVIDQQATERLCASIMLMQDDGQHLQPVAGRHMPSTWASEVAPWPVGAARGACGSAAFRRERVVSRNIASDALWEPERKRLAAQHGFQACWSTPIVSSGGEVLGTVALYYPRPHQPDPLELRLVDIVTRTAAIAIERKRGEEGLKSHSERLRLLWEAAAVLLTTDEPEALIRALFVRIAPHLGLDAFLNHMLNESGEQLELFSFAGVSPQLAGEVSKIAPSSALFGDVVATHEPYSVASVHSSSEPEHELLKSLGLRAYACVPLVAGERLLGTLSFCSRQREHFEADEIEFMRTVTRYLTVAYERLRLLRELRQADRKKDDFIALLAHELRNPLAPLRNGLAVMRLASADAAAMGRAQTIMERQLAHMVRLIDDLLDVSRISLNKMQLRRSPVALSDVMTSAVETARPAIDAAEHELRISLPSERVMLEADLTRLAQVFGNLLTNAAKYTPKRGRIDFSAELQAEAVVIAVADNGIGLRPESLRSIFGMFSQVDHSFERTTGGLGIGLALVKGLSEMHGGSVHAESAGPGQGSRFTVCLPVITAPATEAERASGDSTTLHKAARRILLADDNRDSAESLATMLRLSGNEVHTAHDGVEAVERAESIKPEVILMDVGMPRLNGYDATRRIRSHDWGRRMIVIALTGWGQESDRRQSQEAGCDAHVVKPVDPARLSELIAELCGSAAERDVSSVVAPAPYASITS